MKKLKRKIHWPTKIISNKNYIKEVSIDGKVTNTFNYDYSFFVQDYNFKKYLENLKSVEIDNLNLPH